MKRDRKWTKRVLLIKSQMEFILAVRHEDKEPGTSCLPQLGRVFGHFYVQRTMSHHILTTICTELLEKTLNYAQPAPKAVYCDGLLELLRSSSPALTLTDIMTIENIIKRSKLIKRFLNELQFFVSDWRPGEMWRNSDDSHSRAASSNVLAMKWTQQQPSKRLKR